MRVFRIKDSKEHMCNYCQYRFPTCNPTFIEFGNGIGNDNVTACTGWAYPSAPHRAEPNQIYLAEILDLSKHKVEVFVGSNVLEIKGKKDV